MPLLCFCPRSVSLFTPGSTTWIIGRQIDLEVTDATRGRLRNSQEFLQMTKLMGTIRITPSAGSDTSKPHFEVVFVPYHGRFNTPTVKVSTHDELVQFLMDIKISEDEAARWAGKARSQGVVLISGIERTEAQFRESGLIV